MWDLRFGKGDVGLFGLGLGCVGKTRDKGVPGGDVDDVGGAVGGRDGVLPRDDEGGDGHRQLCVLGRGDWSGCWRIAS